MVRAGAWRVIAPERVPLTFGTQPCLYQQEPPASAPSLRTPRGTTRFQDAANGRCRAANTGGIPAFRGEFPRPGRGNGLCGGDVAKFRCREIQHPQAAQDLGGCCERRNMEVMLLADSPKAHCQSNPPHGLAR